MTANHGKPRYVTVLSGGKTVFSYGDVVSEETFNKENERVRKLKETPATGEVREDGKAKRLPQTKPAVTVACPICGAIIEIPEYNNTTRSDALQQHLQEEHPLHAQNLEGAEMVPPEYRDLIGFLSDPGAEYSLAVQPAVGEERKIDTVLRQLKDGVEGIQDSSRFRLFLTTMSKFHDYSIGNLILITLQRPDATRVTGFVTWKKLDRWVRKGEKGIAILAPMIPSKKKKEEKEEEEGPEDRPMYFKVVYVFDISQTEGEPLPEFDVPALTGEANEELFAKALGLAKARGLEVSFESRPGSPPELKGWFKAPNQIWVRPEEPRAQQLKTLLHEEGHYFSEGVFGIPRRDAETIAESAAYAIGAHYGFDSGVRSFPYVALWAQDKKVLQKNLGEIHKVVTVMLEELDKPQIAGEKFIPALKPFEPYHFAEYVLRYNRFSDAEIPIYSGLTGRNPLRVPDHIWREVIQALDGEFVKQGDINIFHAPEKGRPEYMRAAPTWRDVASTRKLTRADVEVYLSLPPYKAHLWVENKETGKKIFEIDNAEGISRFGSKAQTRDQLEEMILLHLEDIGLLSGGISSAVIPTEEPPPPSPRDEIEFVSDSPEFLAYTIEDIGYRDKLDQVFETAIAKARRG